MNGAELRSSHQLAVDLTEKNVTAVLKSHGLELSFLGRRHHEAVFALRDPAYSHRHLLHALGARWHRSRKCWIILFDEQGRVSVPGRRDGSFAADPSGMDWSRSAAGERQRLRQSFMTSIDERTSDRDLLRLLLSFSVLRADVSHVAGDLLARFGDLAAVLAAEPAAFAECFYPQMPTDGRSGLAEAPADDDLRLTQLLLRTVHAVVKAVLRSKLPDRHLLTSWTSLIDYLSASMQHVAVEEFRVLYLDTKNQLLEDEVVSRGTVDHTPLYVRELVKKCLATGASAIIMVHNHPSGDPTPSQVDVDMTRQVILALQPFKIVVHDHVVIGRNKHSSLRTLGLI